MNSAPRFLFSSASSAASLRRTPWTCRSCLRGRNSTPWRRWNQTAGGEEQQGRSWSSGSGSRSKNNSNKNKRRRILLASTAGAGSAVAATAVAFNDEAKYVVNAAQRSGRVVSTLFININECVVYSLFAIQRSRMEEGGRD
jgi:aarF domain-containing kinase